MTRPLRRPAAALTTLVALFVALIATSVTPAGASSSAAPPSAGSSAPAGGFTAPRVDTYGDTPGDATMANLAAFRARPTLDARKTTSGNHCVVNVAGNCRWNYAAKTDLRGRPRAPEPEQVTCATAVPICVHYATSGPDAPSGVITPSLVLDTLTHIYSLYQSSGYRMPEADHNNGTGSTYVGGPLPTDAIDIYLADIGDGGYYGYCSPEPLASTPNAHHTPAYCTLDNDYSEFSRGTPLTNLEVTAAHEFFHAVQFAYDATEDSWFMESTAVWMEDQVFDNINDNTQYLPFGPLGKPSLSLDKNTQFGVYGGWIFFRWVTEHRPQLVGKLPGIILSMWQRAAAGPHDRYSLQAISSALAAAKMPLPAAFARFSADNRDPWRTYSEGRANHYPVARPATRHVLSDRRRTGGTVRINHLASSTERFTPRGRQLRGKRVTLRLQVDMDDTSRGSAAVVTVFQRNGKETVRPLHLSRHGSGSASVPFSSRKVKRVELTMSNASTRMVCWVGNDYSCQGTPRDMRVKERYSAQVHTR